VCARSAFSTRVHLSYETSLELVSHKFPRKLVNEIRHFSHPPLTTSAAAALLFSLCPVYLPPLYAASIVVPLFYEKLAPDKRSTGKIEPPANRECSPFHVPSIYGSLPALRPSYHDSSSLRLPHFFPSYRYHGKCQ